MDAMKRPFIILLMLSLSLSGMAACGKEDPDKLPAKKSADIIKDYIKTVASAPGKARGAGALVEEQQQKTEDMLKELDE